VINGLEPVLTRFLNMNSDSLNTLSNSDVAMITRSQPVPYYAPQPLHSHDKYVGAIVVVGLVALAFGASLGYALGSSNGSTGNSNTSGSSDQQQPAFTFVHGTVDTGTSFTDGWIYFDSQYTGTLTSTIFPSTSGSLPHGYQLYLPVGKTYTVKIYYRDASGSVQSCLGRPGVFSPAGTDYSQDFLC
jgi:hypothetical protein